MLFNLLILEGFCNSLGFSYIVVVVIYYFLFKISISYICSHWKPTVFLDPICPSILLSLNNICKLFSYSERISLAPLGLTVKLSEFQFCLYFANAWNNFLRPKHTSEDDGSFHYLHCGNVFMDVYVHQNLLNFTI